MKTWCALMDLFSEFSLLTISWSSQHDSYSSVLCPTFDLGRLCGRGLQLIGYIDIGPIDLDGDNRPTVCYGQLNCDTIASSGG